MCATVLEWSWDQARPTGHSAAPQSQPAGGEGAAAAAATLPGLLATAEMRASGSSRRVLLWLLAVPAVVNAEFLYDDYTTLEPGRTDHRQPAPSPW